MLKHKKYFCIIIGKTFQHLRSMIIEVTRVVVVVVVIVVVVVEVVLVVVVLVV